MLNQNLEQIARDNIDKMLRNSGWIIRSKDGTTIWVVIDLLSDIGIN